MKCFFHKKKWVSLRDRDNLQTKDKRPAPKVSLYHWHTKHMMTITQSLVALHKWMRNDIGLNLMIILQSRRKQTMISEMPSLYHIACASKRVYSAILFSAHSTADLVVPSPTCIFASFASESFFLFVFCLLNKLLPLQTIHSITTSTHAFTHM